MQGNNTGAVILAVTHGLVDHVEFFGLLDQLASLNAIICELEISEPETDAGELEQFVEGARDKFGSAARLSIVTNLPDLAKYCHGKVFSLVERIILFVDRFRKPLPPSWDSSGQSGWRGRIEIHATQRNCLDVAAFVSQVDDLARFVPFAGLEPAHSSDRQPHARDGKAAPLEDVTPEQRQRAMTLGHPLIAIASCVSSLGDNSLDSTEVYSTVRTALWATAAYWPGHVEHVEGQLLRLLEGLVTPFSRKISLLRALVETFRSSAAYSAFLIALRDDRTREDVHCQLLVDSMFFPSMLGVQSPAGAVLLERDVLRRVELALMHQPDNCAALPEGTREGSAGEAHISVTEGGENKLGVREDAPAREPASPDARGTTRVAVLVTQLLARSHAPTRLALSYCREISNQFDVIEVTVFVTETFAFPPEERLLPGGFVSFPSARMAAVHEALVGESSVRIVYADSGKLSAERNRETVARVHHWSPDLVLAIGCHHDAARGILFNHYPLIDMSIGGTCFPDDCDVLVTPYSLDTTARLLRDSGLSDRVEKVRRIDGPYSFDPPSRTLSRASAGYRSDDVIVVTVGNRLTAELEAPFCDAMSSFLRRCPNAKWLVVGPLGRSTLEVRLCTETLAQVSFIDFESDLAALYQVCDIYVNPRRKTGGWSAALAAWSCLPIVALRDPSADVMSFLDEEDAEPDLAQFVERLVHLTFDAEERLRAGALMKRRIAPRLEPERPARELVALFDMAIENFERRRADRGWCGTH